MYSDIIPTVSFIYCIYVPLMFRKNALGISSLKQDPSFVFQLNTDLYNDKVELIWINIQI